MVNAAASGHEGWNNDEVINIHRASGGHNKGQTLKYTACIMSNDKVQGHPAKNPGKKAQNNLVGKK